MKKDNFTEFKSKYKIELDPQQEEAVQCVEGPQLILAVPGSGKTTVLINRLGYMIYGCGISPESVLTVTYTTAATRDMEDRFAKYFGEEDLPRLEFRTINGISQKILSYYGYMTGKTPYTIADKEVVAIAREAFRQVNDGFATDNDISNILTGIGYAKNMGFSKEQIRRQTVDVENFPEIFTVYNQLLKNRQLIDYDDQMVYALKILKSVPAVLAHFQEQYRYFLVDEAQDTSKIQHEIIALLASHTDNIFMVGDEDQSIYGFRAAYPQALMDFEKNHPGARVHLLETNYRSATSIVGAASMVISKNTIRHKKQLLAYRQEPGRVLRLETASRKSQYKYICEKIKENPGKIAVLYRNNESALPLIDMLERYNISYRLKNSDAAFFSHPVISDIRDFYALACNPSDDEAFMRIYYKMGVGISKVLAQAAIYNCRSEGILEYIAEHSSSNPGLGKRCHTLANYFAKLATEKASAAIDRIVEKMGYGKFMESRSMDKGKLDILKILSKEVKNMADLFSRMELLKSIMEEGRSNYEADIVLSTIHSAKGLEFDRVYLLDMTSDIIPAVPKPGRYATTEELNAYEEERRLYYVAITRARHELYVFTFDYKDTSIFSRELFSMEKPKDTITGNNYTSPYLGVKRTNYGKAAPNNNR